MFRQDRCNGHQYHPADKIVCFSDKTDKASQADFAGIHGIVWQMYVRVVGVLRVDIASMIVVR